jgi:hypothetical protein
MTQGISDFSSVSHLQRCSAARLSGRISDTFWFLEPIGFFGLRRCLEWKSWSPGIGIWDQGIF